MVDTKYLPESVSKHIAWLAEEWTQENKVGRRETYSAGATAIYWEYEGRVNELACKLIAANLLLERWKAEYREPQILLKVSNKSGQPA